MSSHREWVTARVCRFCWDAGGVLVSAPQHHALRPPPGHRFERMKIDLPVELPHVRAAAAALPCGLPAVLGAAR